MTTYYTIWVHNKNDINIENYSDIEPSEYIKMYETNLLFQENKFLTEIYNKFKLALNVK